MFHPLGDLLESPPATWEESDCKYFIEHYLRQRVRSDIIYCDRITEGVAIIRAGTATLRQMVFLLEFELLRELKKHTDFALTALKVRS